MGWTEQQALGCDVRYIAKAVAEHMEFKSLIHFGKLPGQRRPAKVTAAAFRRFAAVHNATIKGKGK